MVTRFAMLLLCHCHSLLKNLRNQITVKCAGIHERSEMITNIKETHLLNRVDEGRGYKWLFVLGKLTFKEVNESIT